jgi:hypothetical protein
VILAAVLLTAFVFALGGFINAVFAKNFDQVNWDADLRADAAHVFRRRVLFDLAAAGLGAEALVREPDPAHGQRLPLRLPRHLRRQRRVAFAIMALAAAVLFFVAVELMNRGIGMRD